MSEGGPYHINGKPVSRREYLTEHHGELIADVAERGRYGYSYLGLGYLYPRDDSVVPRPDRVSIEAVFPVVDARGLAAPSEFFRGLRLRPRFLLLYAESEGDLSVPGWSKEARRIGKRYDELHGDYITNGKPKLGAVADLQARNIEAREILQHWAEQICLKLQSLREVLAVLFLEAWWATDIEPETPWEDLREEKRKQLNQLERQYARVWLKAYSGAHRSWAIGGKIDDLAIGWLDRDLGPSWKRTQEALLRCQGPPILKFWDERDAMIEGAFPVEVERAACEMILHRIAHGERVEPWGVEDEETLLPPREDLKVQSLPALRDIFALYDFLNKDENRGEEYASQAAIYRAFAESTVGNKSAHESRKSYINKQVDNLGKTIRRTLEWRGANGFPGDNDVLEGGGDEGVSDKQVAKKLHDWLFEIGRSSRPK